MSTMPGRCKPGRRTRVGLTVLVLTAWTGWGIEADACHSTPPPKTTIKRRTVKTTTVTPTPKPSVVVPPTTRPLPLPEVVTPVPPTVPITPTTNCVSCNCPPLKPVSPGTVRPQVETPEPSTVVIGLALIAAASVVRRRTRRA